MKSNTGKFIDGVDIIVILEHKARENCLGCDTLQWRIEKLHAEGLMLLKNQTMTHAVRLHRAQKMCWN